ncbi:23235_t:CDS:2, partial [Dentiscutata erythropus]
GLKNNKITNVKNSIESFLLKAGLSKRAINLLSNFGYITNDYHNCHQTRLPTITSNSKICHIATTLINSMSNVLKIPFISSNNFSVFKSGLISVSHLNNALSNELRNNLISCNSCKLEWNNISDIITFLAESLIESLLVHIYDGTFENQHMRNFNNTKLIDFTSFDLKTTDNYL